jgi:hypothetical protein
MRHTIGCSAAAPLALVAACVISPVAVAGVVRRFRGMVTVALLIRSSLLSMGTAHVDGGDEPQYAEFYTPPDPLSPGQPGDLIRTEPSRLVPEPSGQLGAIVATGTRIMYRSTDAPGNPPRRPRSRNHGHRFTFRVPAALQAGLPIRKAKRGYAGRLYR